MYAMLVSDHKQCRARSLCDVSRDNPMEKKLLCCAHLCAFHAKRVRQRSARAIIFGVGAV